ncbi:MAG: hypothetical protein ACYDHG_09125, partial [Desulfomonilaceae bacterium]
MVAIETFFRDATGFFGPLSINKIRLSNLRKRCASLLLPLEMASATALGPENSKNVSIYANGDSITLAEDGAHFVPTIPT